jgi:hypothetical protein
MLSLITLIDLVEEKNMWNLKFWGGCKGASSMKGLNSENKG